MARPKINDAKRKSAPVRTIALNPPKLENFVRIYRDTFDGEKAARGAGYEDAKTIWPELLAHPDVQARLRGYRSGVDVPARTPEAIFEHLFVQAFEGLEKVLIPDVITGEIRVDLEEAAAQAAGALDFEQTISDRGGIPQRKMRIRKRSNMEVLLSVTRNLGEIETGTEPDLLRRFYEIYMKNVQTVPVVPDDPAKRMNRVNRLKATERADEEDDDPEP